MRKHLREQSCSLLRSRKIARKTVTLTYGVERVITDLSTDGRIFRASLADRYLIGCFIRQHFPARSIGPTLYHSRGVGMDRDERLFNEFSTCNKAASALICIRKVTYSWGAYLFAHLSQFRGRSRKKSQKTSFGTERFAKNLRLSP